MKALRLPACACPVAYLFRYPGSARPSALRARLGGAPGWLEDPSGPGALGQPAAQLPAHSHADAGGISQVPRRSIPYLCPGPRPRPDRRSLTLTVSSMLPPLNPQRRLQRSLFRGYSRGFGTCCLRFTTGVAARRARLASGWLADLYREGVEPSGSRRKVSELHVHPPLLSFSCRKGRLHQQLRLDRRGPQHDRRV